VRKGRTRTIPKGAGTLTRGRKDGRRGGRKRGEISIREATGRKGGAGRKTRVCLGELLVRELLAQGRKGDPLRRPKKGERGVVVTAPRREEGGRTGKGTKSPKR